MEIIIKKLSDKELEKMGVPKWPIWEKEVSSFDWSYSSQEECLILEGEAEIEISSSDRVTIRKGDFVIFPKGLKCKWHIIDPIRKHYTFKN